MSQKSMVQELIVPLANKLTNDSEVSSRALIQSAPNIKPLIAHSAV